MPYRVVVDLRSRKISEVALTEEEIALQGYPPPTVEDYESAIQARVDQTARGRLFRDGVTLASYVASTNEQWAAEAATFVAWRDAVWAYAYAELAKVQAGEREQPTVSEVLTELPAIEWP